MRRPARTTWFRAPLAVLALVTAAGAVIAFRTLPRLDGTVRLPTLQAPVTIRRDAFGVPHIRAGNELDAWSAVGLVHAQDRLFQMDFVRRVVAGRLSEVVGAGGLESDRKYRRLQMAATARTQLGELPPATLRALEAYASGVNAGLADTGRPIECWLLRYRPEPWTPLDTLLVLKFMEDLLATDGGEEIRAKLTSELGPDLASYLFDLQGIDGATILADGGSLAPPGPPAANPAPARPGHGDPRLPPWMQPEPEPVAGSNSWVVSGERSRTGLPLLANDTHLPALVPSIFYQTHVTFPGADIAGMTIPGEPFAVLGHNGKVAWGVTTLMADQVDFVRLPLDPDDPFRYRTTTGFTRFERREEAIAVRGGSADRLTVRWSPWGPVVGEEGGAALARDWVADHHSRALVAVHAFQQAASVAEFLAFAADLTTPGMNLVAADRDGNIAYYPGGAIPIRASGDGRMPVDAGVGPAGWPEFVPAAEAPALSNPRRGYVVTANNQVGRSPRARRISSYYAEPFRADRITAEIERQARHDVATLAAIQLDAVNLSALRLIRALPEGPLTEPLAARWWSRLRRWDGGYRRGPEPAVFEAFSRRLRELVFADDAGPLWTWGSLGLLKASNACAFREVPPAMADRDWFDDIRTDGHETQAEMVERAIGAALADLAERFGPSEADWAWERVHTLRATHPLVGIPVVGWLFRLSPLALPGSAETVNANSGSFRDGFRVRWAPAFRMVIDLDDPGRSRIVNSTGQSGNPFSRHYSDQHRAWAAGASYPMLYREDDVRRATTHTLTLTPR